jgi:hypothetical protein
MEDAYSKAFNRIIDKAEKEDLVICQIQNGNRAVSGNAHLMYIPKKVLETSLTSEGNMNPRFMVYLKNNFIRKIFPYLHKRELPEEFFKKKEKIIRPEEHYKMEKSIKDGKYLLEDLKENRLGVEVFEIPNPINSNKDLTLDVLNNLFKKNYSHLWTKYLGECFDNHW